MKNNELSIFAYNGKDITLKAENGMVYVNLSEVAKAFPDKNLTQIVNSQEIKEYVKTLSELQNYSSADLLKVTRGGNVARRGTWAHQKVALRVCQRLSTEFAIMVDTKIEELLTRGYTKLDSITRTDLARMLLESETEKEAIETRLSETRRMNSLLSFKANFFDKVLFAEGTYTTTHVASEVGMTARQLNQKLNDARIIRKVGKRWIPRARYVGKGYHCYRTYIEDSTGVVKSSSHMVWTEKGRLFIHSLFKEEEKLT